MQGETEASRLDWYSAWDYIDEYTDQGEQWELEKSQQVYEDLKAIDQKDWLMPDEAHKVKSLIGQLALRMGQ